MSTPDPWKPSRYSPTPGTERCRLCREMEGPDHVRHPWSQILAWRWATSPAWRWSLIVLLVLAAFCLAPVIAAVRALIFGS